MALLQFKPAPMYILDEVDAALARVEAGTYGTCETCGRPIAEARLEVRPVARQCIECASASSRR